MKKRWLWAATLLLVATMSTFSATRINLATQVRGTLGETNGGTAQNTYALGDTLYSDAADSLAKLSGNITTTKKFLSQTGTGAVSAAPVWDDVNFTNLLGTATKAQLPSEIAYEDEVNTFTGISHFTDSGTQVHFRDGGADNGGFLVSVVDGQAIVVGGARFDGTNWIARNATATIMSVDSGLFKIFVNTGLTIGNSFTVTEVFRVGADVFRLGTSGAVITNHLSNTATLNFPSIGANTCGALNIAVTGAAVNDVVALGVPSTAVTGLVSIVYWAYVSASSNVNVRACNLANVSVNPGSGTFRADVWQH